VNVPGIILHPGAESMLDKLLHEPPHAVLVTGPVGIGKTHIARNLGAALLQTTEATLENQAYYREIVPEKDTIAIEEVRKLLAFFRLTVPGEARVKRVAVLADAETMSREAQNALLKLLEEPPTGSVLILTSSQPNQLLATVRSRTQVLMLPAPDRAALLAHFTATDQDTTAIERVLLRTGSNVAEATRLAAAGSASSDDALDLVKKVLVGTTYDRMLLVDALSKQKEQAKGFVDTLATTAVASLQTAAVKNPAALPRWQSILSVADTATSAMDRSGNTKLVLTELMLAL
jgi:DNA polymerase III delta prime subunit